MPGTQKATLRRFPKVLADELHLALGIVHRLGQERALELLDNYRRNHAKCIATWGVLTSGASVQGLKPIPEEHVAEIARLDEAFRKLHAYRHGGAEEYAAADVERAINSLRARGTRSRSTEHAEICEWLQGRGYTKSDNKKDLVSRAAEHFDVSGSTVQRALRQCNMTRGKKSTVT